MEKTVGQKFDEQMSNIDKIEQLITEIENHPNQDEYMRSNPHMLEIITKLSISAVRMRESVVLMVESLSDQGKEMPVILSSLETTLDQIKSIPPKVNPIN